MNRFVRLLATTVWREWIRPLAVPLLLVAAAKSALADINYVPSGSMQPTIAEGDVVFVNKLAYDVRVPFTLTRVATWSAPARGDIVVCFSPADGKRLVKRVVGLPGDVVELRGDVLILNGTAQTASFTGAPEIESAAGTERSLVAREKVGRHEHAVRILPDRSALRNFGPVVVPPDSYFMLGDNRDNSFDSRFFGPVPRAQIVGEAKGVFVSADLAHWLRPRWNRFFTALE